MVSKDVLAQYTSIKKEIEEIEDRIAKTEKELDRLLKEGTVIDKVMGGEGGIKPYTIEGMPVPAISRKKTLLMSRKRTLTELECDLLSATNEVEEFLSNVDDSIMRRVIDCRFLKGLTWEETARQIGSGSSGDSLRVSFDRFMKKF